MTKVILFALMICLIPLYNAFSADRVIEGEISGVGRYVGVEGGESGKAKFTEYRDLRENGGFYGRARLKFDTEEYFLKFEGGDFAYDTQYYNIEAGMWGKFKLDLFYDEIPHNITFKARTFFLGAGHDTLIGVPNTNVSTWNSFDYSVERRQYGGGLKVNLIKPFFFDVSFQREDRDGIKPAGIAASSPGGFAVELPEPIHYTMNNLKVEGGYAKRPLFLSMGFIYSDFNNSNDKLNFTHPITPFPMDTLTLPPDNKYYKGFAKGAVKLPLNSRFNVNLGYSSARSDTNLLNSIVDGGTITPLTLSKADFDGRIDTQNYSFVLTSNPLRFLDAKIFYSYYKKENKNDMIFQDDGSGSPIEFNKPFEYKKNAAGMDLGFRLPANLYLSGGYKYIKTDRKVKGLELLEFDPILLEAELELIPPDNTDNIWSADLKWSGLDFLAVRAGYEKLHRTADFPDSKPDNRRFAYAGQNRSTYRASVDIFPIENLNFTFEYQHKITNYKENFGLKKDNRDEVDISADYIIGKIAKVYAFSDFERIKFHQPEQSQSPLGEWDARQKDRSWGYGIGTEIYAIPNKLTLVLQHDYLRSNGDVDFTFASSSLFGSTTGLVGANNDIIDILRWDDYTKYSFKIKAIYSFTKSITASIGYAFERFNYKDAQLDGYNFTPTGPASNTAFLTGAYKDQSYKANLVFGGLSYKF